MKIKIENDIAYLGDCDGNKIVDSSIIAKLKLFNNDKPTSFRDLSAIASKHGHYYISRYTSSNTFYKFAYIDKSRIWVFANDKILL